MFSMGYQKKHFLQEFEVTHKNCNNYGGVNAIWLLFLFGNINARVWFDINLTDK